MTDEKLRTECVALVLQLNEIRLDQWDQWDEQDCQRLMAFAKLKYAAGQSAGLREAATLIEDGVDVKLYEGGSGIWKTCKTSHPKSMARACIERAAELDARGKA